MILEDIWEVFALHMVSHLSPPIVWEDRTDSTSPLRVTRLFYAVGEEIFRHLWIVYSVIKAWAYRSRFSNCGHELRKDAPVEHSKRRIFLFLVNLLIKDSPTLDLMAGKSIFGLTKLWTNFTIVSVVVWKVLGLQVKAGDWEILTLLPTEDAVVSSSRFVPGHFGSEALLQEVLIWPWKTHDCPTFRDLLQSTFVAFLWKK